MPLGSDLCSGRPSCPPGGCLFQMNSHPSYYNSRGKTSGEVGVRKTCQDTVGVTGLGQHGNLQVREEQALPTMSRRMFSHPSALPQVGLWRPVRLRGCNSVFGASAILAAFSGGTTEASSAPASGLSGTFGCLCWLPSHPDNTAFSLSSPSR